MRFRCSILTTLALSFLSCLASATNFKVVESLPEVPWGWTQGARAHPKALIKFRLSVTKPDFHLFEGHIMNISTPGNSLYGQHLSQHAINMFLQPQPLVREEIMRILHAFGIQHDSIGHKRQWITFTASVATAEQFLDTKFHYYHKANGASIIRTLKYSLPQEVYEHVQLIQPTTRFGVVKPQVRHIVGESEAVNPANIFTGYDARRCNHTITPDCLRGLYQLGNSTNVPASSNGNTLGVSGFLEEWASYRDLSLFTSNFAPYASEKNFSVVSINGGENQQSSRTQESREANLDIQYSISLAPNIPVTYFTTGGRGPLIPEIDEPSLGHITNEPYLEQLHYLNDLSDDDLPTVLSTSYGEDEQSLPKSYAVEVCMLFLSLTSRGVSIIFASGDSGPGSSCTSNDGNNTAKYLSVFPATCPYVTSVGGTTGIEPERAASFSSGGFSDYFLQPSYQRDAVQEYVDCHGNSTHKTYYHRYGRATPDVSAQAANYLIVNKGQTVSIGGTSTAAPTFAAMIANINALRFAAGLSSMGFLNPFLYGYGKHGLTDIIEGGSIGCNGFSLASGEIGTFIPYAGWNATVGWDPVTGLGTPRFQDLAKASLELNQTSWRPRDCLSMQTC